MKLAIKTLALATALAAGSAAYAGDIITGTLTSNPGDHLDGYGLSVHDLVGSGNLVFSTQLLTAFNAGGIDINPIDPANVSVTRNTKGAYTAVSASTPIYSLSGQYDGSILTVNQVATKGGAELIATADDLTNTGGDMKISNISVDLDAKTIYADLFGANGVGAVAHKALWTFDTMTGDRSFPTQVGTVTSKNTVTGLHITADAKQLMVQSLGLTADLGVAALNKISDYGSIASTISATVTPVPEPSTYALMGLGLVGVSVAARRRMSA